jgi:hypothetical protein
MISIKNIPIRDKIRRMILLTSGSALVLIGTVIITRDFVNEHIKISYHFSSLKNYAASLNSGMLGFRNSMVAFAAARTASTGFWF